MIGSWCLLAVWLALVQFDYFHSGLGCIAAAALVRPVLATDSTQPIAAALFFATGAALFVLGIYRSEPLHIIADWALTLFPPALFVYIVVHDTRLYRRLPTVPHPHP
jgi:hypothetical protein